MTAYQKPQSFFLLFRDERLSATGRVDALRSVVIISAAGRRQDRSPSRQDRETTLARRTRLLFRELTQRGFSCRSTRSDSRRATAICV